MSETCNKPKSDITALYKLEFYKKQKNWKFCRQVLKKEAAEDDPKSPPPKAEKKLLNKTYIIEVAGDPPCSELNDAFVESDNGVNSPDSPISPGKEWSSDVNQSCNNISSAYQEGVTPSQDKPKLSPKTIPNEPENSDNSPQYALNSSQDLTDGLTPPPKKYKRFAILDYVYLQKEPNQNENSLDYGNNWLQQKLKFNDAWLQENHNKYPKCAETVNCDNNTNDRWMNILTVKRLDKEINNNEITIPDWFPIEKLSEHNLETQVSTQALELPRNFVQNNNNGWPNEIWANIDQKEIPENLLQNRPNNECHNEVWPNFNQKELPEIDRDGYEDETGWPHESQVWTNLAHPEFVWSNDVLHELELLGTKEVEPEMRVEPNKWVPPDRLLEWMLANKECRSEVLESSLEGEAIMRELHCAPHSSEINLPGIDTSTEEVLTDPLECYGSGPAIVAERMRANDVRAAAQDLRQLRISREQRPRTTSFVQAQSPHYDISCEEYPTRDIGLYQPTFTDSFITGSFKNNPNYKIDNAQTEKYINIPDFSNFNAETKIDQLPRNFDSNFNQNLQRQDIWGEIPQKSQVGQKWNEVGLGDAYDEDFEYIGRGRGRLPITDNNIGPGRGRGRI